MKTERVYGTGLQKSTKEHVILRLRVALLNNSRVHIVGKAPLEHHYFGLSHAPRKDPFWHEHKGGRIYAEDPRPLLEKLYPHVGQVAFEKAEIMDP